MFRSGLSVSIFPIESLGICLHTHTHTHTHARIGAVLIVSVCHLIGYGWGRARPRVDPAFTWPLKHSTVAPLENSEKQEQAYHLGSCSKLECANLILKCDRLMMPNIMVSLVNKCSHPKAAGSIAFTSRRTLGGSSGIPLHKNSASTNNPSAWAKKSLGGESDSDSDF